MAVELTDPVAAVERPAGRQGVRGLRPWQRACLLLAVLIIAAASVRSIAAASSHGVTPDGDAAVHVRLSQTASSDHLLLGPGASTGYYGGRPTHHPGPLLFYAGQPFIDAFGSRLGSWMFTALVNGGCVLVAGWAGLRTGGFRGALALLLGGAAVIASAIPGQFLVMHITYMGALPLYAGLAAAWAVADGDWLFLPVLAALASLATQTEVEYVLPFAPVVLAAPLYGVWRVRARGRSLQPVVWWAGGTALLSSVLWFPSIFEQLFRGHNMTMLLGAHVPTRGFSGASLVVGTMLLGPPLFVGPSHLTYSDLHAIGVRSVVVVAIVAALVLVQHRRGLRQAGDPPGSALLVVVVAAVFGAALGGTALPQGDGNPQHLIWVRCIGPFAWAAVGLYLLPLLLRTIEVVVRSRARMRIVAVVPAVWMLAATVSVGTAAPVDPGSLQSSKAIDELVPQLATRLPRHQPIVVTSIGLNSWIVAPGLVPRLEELGHPSRFGVGPGPDTRIQLVLSRSLHRPSRRATRVAVSHPRVTDPHRVAELHEFGRWVRAHGPLVLSTTAREALAQVVDGLRPSLCVDDLREHPMKLFDLGGDSVVAAVYAMGLVLSPRLPPGLDSVPLRWADGLDSVVWRVEPMTSGDPTSHMLFSSSDC